MTIPFAVIRAFTGPTVLNPRQRQWVAKEVARLGRADEVRTGCAEGVDTIAALVSAANIQDAKHVLYVPEAPHHDQMVAVFRARAGRGNVEIVQCPKGSSRSQTYRIRNVKMIEGHGDQPVMATELVAFVTQPDFYRSGEWMTINIAQRYDIPVKKLVIL